MRETEGKRTVFGNVVKVVTADDDGPGHLGGDNSASENATANGDLASKWALLVCCIPKVLNTCTK